MVFYRKYRPQKIEELDSKEVREKLYNVLESSSVPHAFLFTGSKGLGKTSTARIVAKVLNCEKKTKGIEPCNKCEQCVSITNGTNMDILEIDGASNRGIDEIRDLREKVKLSPMSATRKVYIIDEVHMLTTEAFNALLKTLEEPPSHVVFILCTTEPHKVPQTIASRCFQISFKKATADELIRSFLRIAKREKISIDKEALFKISEFSDGSFRDGVKILEEIAQEAGNKKITKDMVERVYKVTNIDNQIDKMIEFLCGKNAKEAISLVGKLTEGGTDIKYFMERLVLKLHELLLIKVGVSKEKSDIDLNIEDIKTLMDLLTKAHGRLKYSVLSQLPLEIAIIEWSASSVSALPYAESDARNADVEILNNPRSLSDRRRQNSVQSPNDTKPAISSLSGRQSSDSNIWSMLIDKVKLDENKTRELLKKVSEDIIGNKVDILVVLKENPKYKITNSK